MTLKTFFCLLLLQHANAKVHLCHEEKKIIGTMICKLSDDYNKAHGQHPLPLVAKEKIILYDIPELNQEDKTITLFMTLIIHWNDSRLMLKTSDPTE